LEFLNAKIREENLTGSEHAELLGLIEVQEKWAANRMEDLAKLAILRNTDYVTLIQQLGLSKI